jgi:sugar transferase EpsL
MESDAYLSSAKRATDVVVALLLLILTGPIILVAMLAIAATMGHPVLFIQERTGQSGQQFRLYKFRTMKNARGAGGGPLPDAARITALGRFLRKTSIDELPELINVLLGHMSLVGPRPLLPRYDAWYSEREALRFAARPGITGLAQVSGRNQVGWDARLETDVRYVVGWSYWTDLRILARTATITLTGSGAVVDPSAIMQDLDVERACRS